MTPAKRTNKTVSFSHVDAFERELLDYALSASHGKFGPYVKRLIDRDRAQLAGNSVMPTPAPIVTDAAITQPNGKVTKTVAKAFL